MDGPLHTYRARVADGSIASDPGQAMALEKLQLLWNRLKERGDAKPTAKPRGWFGFGAKAAKPEPQLNGVYLYGGVGIGKSMMMDLFHANAPVEKKRRVHFHDFMQSVHAELREERKRGTTDPLIPIAKRIAAEARLLCFDEMQVTDIADAMILSHLFEGLFDAGVVVVATSNRHPTDLYKNGLNRHLFEPFIALLQERLDVLHVDGPPDYRKLDAERGGVYFTPVDEEASRAFDDLWRSFCGASTPFPAMLNLQGRFIDLPLATKTEVRASFADLCAKPLGPGDYLLLAKTYETVFLEDVPLLTPDKRDQAKRFVTLIDALYEARARLVMLAAAEPEGLYPKGDGAFEFERTASRLMEMRSERYLKALG
jgi:cell division protein ZapE